MEDEDRPRPRGDAASLLGSESLDSYSRFELEARLQQLEAEITRVCTHRDKADAHRSAADLLFKPKG